MAPALLARLHRHLAVFTDDEPDKTIRDVLVARYAGAIGHRVVGRGWQTIDRLDHCSWLWRSECAISDTRFHHNMTQMSGWFDVGTACRTTKCCKAFSRVVTAQPWPE